ncbi:MAG: glycosyltransferase, partial [Fusobacteriaceae bacterium]
MKKVILTTGGTGGHIYPALSVADELAEREVEILFVGTTTRMEKDIVPESGYRFIGLDIYPIKSFM